MKNLFAILLIFVLSSCSKQLYQYDHITVYDPIDNSDDRSYASTVLDGNIEVNTSRKYIKANVFGEEKKFKIEFFVYGYPPFTFLFRKKKDRKSITVFCENGYKFYIEFGQFCILTIPDDGDEDICDNRIFYSL